MDPNDIEPIETATPAGMSKSAVRTDTASPEAGGRIRRWLRLGAGWRFARHLLEMVVAMMAGMAVLGVALGVLGEPPGYSNLFVEYGLMAVSMSAPMVAYDRAQWASAIADAWFGVDLPGVSVSPELVRWGVGLFLQASPMAAIDMLCARSSRRTFGPTCARSACRH